MLVLLRALEKMILCGCFKGNVMKRIVILGVTGSGKTTFGRRLGEKLGLPATDLDDLHWLPGWKPRELDSFRQKAAETAAGEGWIIIGNYSKVRDCIWPHADTFIWIDYPFLLTFWQLLRRSVLRAVDKNLICNGNVESWRQMFSKDSIMIWLFRTYRRRQREYGEMFEAAGNSPAVRYIRLRSRNAAESFLNDMT